MYANEEVGDSSRYLVIIESDIAWRIDVRGPHYFSDQHSFQDNIITSVSPASLKIESVVEAHPSQVKTGGSAPWTAALLALV